MKKSEKIAFFSVKGGTVIDNLPELTVIRVRAWKNIDFVIVGTTKTGVTIKNPNNKQRMTVPFSTTVEVIPECYYRGVHF